MEAMKPKTRELLKLVADVIAMLVVALVMILA